MTKTSLTPNEFANVFSGREVEHDIDASVIGAVSAAVLRRVITRRKCVLRGLRMKMGTCGTAAGPSTATVNVNGVAVTGLSVSIAHDDADGIEKFDAPTSETIIPAGSAVDIEVTAAATNAANATLRAELVEVFD